MLRAIVVFALVGAGCNESSTEGDFDDFTETIVSSYSIGAASEAYRCTRVSVSATRWIKAFMPSLGTGVYRAWLAVDETPGSPGTAACSAALENDWRLVFVAGLGTGALVLPGDVGFNTAGSLAGSASIETLIAGSATGFQEAEGFLAGDILFSIPASQTFVVSGGCTLPAATSIFAVMPYMNKFGTHAKVWTDMPTHTVVDLPYDHNAQAITTISPYAVDPGERVRTEFTYVNTTGVVVTFGESANDEQSFVMTYVTPPIGMTWAYCIS